MANLSALNGWEWGASYEVLGSHRKNTKATPYHLISSLV